jgi:hypothetical protein
MMLTLLPIAGLSLNILTCPDHLTDVYQTVHFKSEMSLGDGRSIRVKISSCLLYIANTMCRICCTISKMFAKLKAIGALNKREDKGRNVYHFRTVRPPAVIHSFFAHTEQKEEEKKKSDEDNEIYTE